MAGASRKALTQMVKSLLDTGKYTDLVITCGADTYKVHKNIVCTQSGFFERAERFAVGKEHAEGIIDLPEEDPDLMKPYIQFLYESEYDPRLTDDETTTNIPTQPIVTATKKGKYSYKFPHTCDSFEPSEQICPHHQCDWDFGPKVVGYVCRNCCSNHSKGPPCPTGGADQLLLHAQMYELGDKYDTPSLKALALEKFRRACHVFWDCDAFARAAHHAFSTTPESDMGLRNIVILKISENLKLFNKPAIEAVITEFNCLAVGVLRVKAKE